MERWFREAARWRLELERPWGEASGLWRSEGWDLRMRLTRSASAAWMARRRRSEGSILLECQPTPRDWQGKERSNWLHTHDGGLSLGIFACSRPDLTGVGMGAGGFFFLANPSKLSLYRGVFQGPAN